jgi:nucleotide-binding universal stress UspA family protein
LVVGIDGSAEAWRALEWAVAEARLRGAALLVVHTFDYGIAAADQSGMLTLDAFTEQAKRVLDEAVGYVRSRQVEVHGLVEYGSPAKVLLEVAREADLLVVGSRGHGGLAGTLLGSVSSTCVHHAVCPVVVIPRATTGGDA